MRSRSLVAPLSDAEEATKNSLLYRWLIAHAGLFTAWLFNVIYSTALVYLSTWVVVNVAPEAGGAGVAEVTAYLNGCNLPKVSDS